MRSPEGKCHVKLPIHAFADFQELITGQDGGCGNRGIALRSGAFNHVQAFVLGAETGFHLLGFGKLVDEDALAIGTITPQFGDSLGMRPGHQVVEVEVLLFETGDELIVAWVLQNQAVHLPGKLLIDGPGDLDQAFILQVFTVASPKLQQLLFLLTPEVEGGNHQRAKVIAFAAFITADPAMPGVHCRQGTLCYRVFSH